MASDNGPSGSKKPNDAKAGASGAPLPLATGALAPIGAGGIRSPLIGGANISSPPPTDAEEPAHGKPPTATAPTPKRASDISAIGGLDATNDELIPSRVSSLQSLHLDVGNVYARERQKRFWSTSSFFIVLIIGVLVLKPDWAEKLLGHISNIGAGILGDAPSPARQHGKRPPLSKSVAARSGREGGGDTGSCRMLLNRPGIKTKPAVSIAAAECFLAQDNLVAAESLLKPYRSKVVTLTEAPLNAQKGSNTEVDTLFLLAQVYLKEGRLLDADKLVQGRCQQWQRTNLCVAKLMVLTERKLVNSAAEGLKRMLASRGGTGLDAKTQARFYLAAGSIEQQQGRYPIAERYFQQALKAAGERAPVIRKYVYETQAIGLYQRGDMIKLRTWIGQGLQDLKKMDAGAKVKLRLLADLSRSDLSPASLQTILNREEITYRARSDYELIDIIGPEALRRRQEDLYLQLLRRTKVQYGTHFKASSDVMRRLTMWEIRATLGLGKFDAALLLLKAYEREYQPDAVAHHLRGVAMLGIAASQRQAAQAAMEFKQALRASRNWESLYALGAALIRGGKAKEVAAVIKDMEQRSVSKGQKFWLDMLKAEWMIASGQGLRVEKSLIAWTVARPAAYTPRWLLLSLYRKLDKQAEKRQIEVSLEELASRQAYRSSREAMASPLGVMALAPRPLE